MDIEFEEDTNLIIGDNGAGKTNIIEAIYYLSTSKSFRNSLDRDIKNWNKDEFAIKGYFYSEDEEIIVNFKYSNGRKELYINEIPEDRVTKIVGKIFIVPFLFDDIYLISGSPAKRRSFIDLTLSMVDSFYFENLKDYIFSIRQKNSLLKNERIVNKDLLNVWNEKISEYASYLVWSRKRLVDNFNGIIGKLGEKAYSSRFLFNIKYRSMVKLENDESIDDIKKTIFKKLNNNMEKEIALKSCFYGPHREDFTIYKDNYTVRKFGSIGEGRITSIILKKCQVEFYKQFKKVNPILLIDDVFLELDNDKRRLAKTIIDDNSQIIITTTSVKNIPDNFKYKKLFHIENGKVDKEVIY